MAFIKEWGDADAIAALGEEVSDAESDEESDEVDDDSERLEVEELSEVKKKKGKSVLSIWTDGSSLKNGRAGAAAGVGVFFGLGDTRYDILHEILLFPCSSYPMLSSIT